MAAFARFEDLDDEGFFVALVTNHFQNGEWGQITADVGLKPVVDPERVKFAFEAYQNNVSETKIRLHSQNPDHYKRAACLLDALNRAQVIQDLEQDGVLLSQLRDGSAFGLSWDDCQFRLKFVTFFHENANQVAAFDLAFRCCQTYEEANRPYTPNYLENVVHFLCDHSEQNLGALYMVFRTYWN